MATVAEWIEGARPRTLPNAIAPVLVGVGAAAQLDAVSWWRSLLALLVAVALIIGVNYANDYSDGVRGTDNERVGPLRLVGSGAASAKAVLGAALGLFLLAALFGLVLVLASGQWWLLLVGASCIAGAWFYTGGSRPYGYAGFGEVAVFVFFGLTAVLGTVYVQAERVSWEALGCAVAVGCLSVAVLVANNLRDIPTDREAGKITLAVRLGDRGTRRFYLALVTVPFLVTAALAFAHPVTSVGLLAAPLLVTPVRAVMAGNTGVRLIPVLRDTGMAMLAWAILTGAALAFTG
ncbi:1,4-dihydroxy-2-naphthoate polyprenyltransferase [Saccharomonospora viridis]|jgi:1,4-dihydroxy-2-naphthoate polyprenyltransferase|uniref:1,4-dihydroxy-2-naphthoate octaprenyltransferase n=1 Tax=Saccharomonospora viridis (strain ATCC 15386 / DSM 43017 / JCM 3036 / CCUG 5913 / NBRC 12207 / NCIMB 9602 / P101) TaxID=471857 RepID=C7MTB5_SACVD|nr:1,4-dihydroxy-2-naphthoate polyprenyltransferase [Saccharomonospora viridis]ACU95385.1 1,4-dihydroxy-2-naphtoate prenyltransferase [Saccharomonospora viridis DSM 43017]